MFTVNKGLVYCSNKMKPSAQAFGKGYFTILPCNHPQNVYILLFGSAFLQHKVSFDVPSFMNKSCIPFVLSVTTLKFH